MKCNKLIIYIGTLQSGGAERVVSEIASMYANYMNEVIILTYYDMPVFYHIDPRVRIECVERLTKTKSKLKNAIWLRKYVKKEKPDVFLSFLMPFNMMAIAALAFIKQKIVVCERQDPSDVKTPLLRTIRNFLYYFCSRIEVQTIRGKHYFSKSLQRKIVVIPNPNHITAEERRKSLTIVKENRAVTVGRLTPVKNHRLLLNAFSKVHKLHPEYKLDIYGDGELYDEILEQIHELGLNDSIFLKGRSDDIPSALASARIFVLCSNVEGMSNALMEAAALGIPCIATDVSGVRDIITDGENGFVTPVGDEFALIDNLLKLMDSEGLQRQFSENSSVILDKFDKNIILQQWLDIVDI